MTLENPLLTAVLGRGVLRDPGPVVTADDLGLTRGDGVFDATRTLTTAGGSTTVDDLEDHLARFARSIAGIDGPAPDLDAWRNLIDAATTAWTQPGEGMLKLMYTNGHEVTAGPPTGLLTLSRLPDHLITARDGIGVALLSRGYPSDAFADAPWLLGGVKTLSYAVNVAAAREAGRRGVDDIVFTSSDGYLLEGPTSGIVMADGDTLVTTPTGPTGILASVTVDHAMTGAAVDGVSTLTRLIRPEELSGCNGLWILNSGSGVAPILTVDSRPVPQNPAMTRQLRHWTGFAA